MPQVIIIVFIKRNIFSGETILSVCKDTQTQYRHTDTHIQIRAHTHTQTDTQTHTYMLKKNQISSILKLFCEDN